MDDLILVTGGSGFIGGMLCGELLRQGRRVRTLWHPRNLAPPRDLDIDFFIGDVTSQSDVREAMSGVSQLYHLAADYRLWAKDAGQMSRVNVDGVRHVMEAALEEGVNKVVHVSSVSTLATSELRPCTEQDLLIPEKAPCAYSLTKLRGESYVRDLIASRGLPAVIIKPTTTLGSGDGRPTPSGRIIRDYLRHPSRFYVDTGLNIVHVRDVVDGLISAMARGRVGEDYILGGENMSLLELFRLISQQINNPPPTLRLPFSPLIALAHINEKIAMITNKEPQLSVAAITMAQNFMFYDDSKARRDLQYSSRPASQTILDAVAWFSNKSVFK